jgi:hypothetical protein
MRISRHDKSHAKLEIELLRDRSDRKMCDQVKGERYEEVAFSGRRQVVGSADPIIARRGKRGRRVKAAKR